MTTPDIAEARRLADLFSAPKTVIFSRQHDEAAAMLRALADELERLRQAAELDLRDDVIESLKGDLAQERALCEERGRRLDEQGEELERLRAQVAQDSSLTALRDMLRAEVDRLNAAKVAPAGWKLVPAEILDRFPEINPSNYDHDDACALNAWGVDLVLAASPAAPAQQAPDNNSLGRGGCFPAAEKTNPALTVGDEPVAYMREDWSPDCGPYFDFYRPEEMSYRDKSQFTPLYAAPKPAAQAEPVAVKYVSAMGQAADNYINKLGGRSSTLPAPFRWEECLAAMLAAAPSNPPAQHKEQE